MPEWFDPLMNTSLATGLIGFACWGAVRVVRFCAPKITSVTEGHVTVMAKLGDAAEKQSALMERQTLMLSDHTTTLNVHGQILNSHSEQLRTIAERVAGKPEAR